MRLADKYYQVNPRYTSGSPAMVSRETTLEVAADEVEAFNTLLNRGEPTKGLGNIILEYYTRFDKVWYTDLMTRNCYVRMECKTSGLKPNDRIIRCPTLDGMTGKVVECKFPLNGECIVIIKTETAEVMTAFNKDYRFFIERDGW